MTKEIIIIGLGRMGLNMATLLLEKGYTVYGTDKAETTLKTAEEIGITTFSNYSFLKTLSAPRTVWLMVPAKFVDTAIAEILPFLKASDTLIDGGNSFYQDSIRRHQEITTKNINYLDVGTSGGTDGARHGSSLMIGGEKEIFQKHETLFKDLATKNGYAHVGKAGAGHFVKMIHNGIEYGMMGALAEGFDTLKKHEEELDLNINDIFRPYQNGSIIASNLTDYLHSAFASDLLDKISGEVPKGETESEMEFITTLNQSLVLAAALKQRQETRNKPSYLGKLLAAMRHQFGGHAVIKNDK